MKRERPDFLVESALHTKRFTGTGKKNLKLLLTANKGLNNLRLKVLTSMPPQISTENDNQLSPTRFRENCRNIFMLTMTHVNSVAARNGMLITDRKFHEGMLRYAANIPGRIVTVNPELAADDTVMDQISVPVAGLPYEVLPLPVDATRNLLPSSIPTLAAMIGSSDLVYGSGIGSDVIARRLGVPYISVLEYDLQTLIIASTSQVRQPHRKAVRAVKGALAYLRHGIREMRGAAAIHCNGYPIYEVARKHNANCLLYLDSRMSADMVIPTRELEARLAGSARTLRLLYSGRYERLKGADDVVKVAVDCLRRGIDIELHTYGRGDLKDEMLRLANGHSRIVIHDAVPYPELVQISRRFDAFLCCHIQSDPSCTYLESFGAGLPIIGYANRMWSQLREDSQAGLSSPMGKPARMADLIAHVSTHRPMVETMSRRALGFAREHCFEREFDKRIQAINDALTATRKAPSAALAAKY